MFSSSARRSLWWWWTIYQDKFNPHLPKWKQISQTKILVKLLIVARSPMIINHILSSQYFACSEIFLRTWLLQYFFSTAVDMNHLASIKVVTQCWCLSACLNCFSVTMLRVVMLCVPWLVSHWHCSLVTMVTPAPVSCIVWDRCLLRSMVSMVTTPVSLIASHSLPSSIYGLISKVSHLIRKIFTGRLSS